MSGEEFYLYVAGRLRGITRKRLAHLAAQAGGRVIRRPSARVSLVAVGHSSADYSLARGPRIALPGNLRAEAQVISELRLRRMLGVSPPLPEEPRTFTQADLATGARLNPEVVRSLSLYDVIEPVEDRYGFRDLVVAREVARLLHGGLELHAIVRAAIWLRDSGRTLSDTRLFEAPWGEIVQDLGGRFSHLDGQLALSLDESFESADELFERAEEAEGTGDLAAAERWYRLALDVDRTDPVIPFNLGNVLDGQGSPKDAALAYQQATARDPAFAEAWLNLGVVRESMDRAVEAIGCYRKALDARPDYAEALFNLASLLTRTASYSEAIPLWDWYLSLQQPAEHAGEARRFATLCRLQALAS